jgi:hypothetical protein
MNNFRTRKTKRPAAGALLDKPMPVGIKKYIYNTIPRAMSKERGAARRRRNFLESAKNKAASRRGH